MSTVPELIRGAWRRTSIVNADGSSDTTSIVVWLQLDSAMVDVRLAADLSELADRGSLNACSTDDLRRLAASEASTGYTTCTDPAADGTGTRRAVAEWITRGPDDIALHPVTAYPEPGELEWNADGSIMIERAPSGAYVEEWHRVPGSDGRSDLVVFDSGRRIYVTGDIAVLVRDRPNPLPRAERLDILAAEVGNDRSALADLVDCEFSIAERTGDGFRISASTLPWRIGEDLDVPA